jgi:LysM repeat protein
MTSDAKIGLLLGLVFIFIIAFLINGWPRFRSENNNELTSTMFNSQNDGFGLGAKERKVIEQNEPLTTESKVRSERPLPGSLSDGKSVGPGPSPAMAKDKQEAKGLPKQPALAKVYVVLSGDNLSRIAKKFYGDKEGNRFVNIMRIFQANRRVLKSADEIYEGQKIMIPPLPATVSDKKKIEGIFPAAMFEKDKSVGKTGPSSSGAKAKQGGLYVVREGDSLWRIAAKQLGDAARYMEIAKLNVNILEDEDSLSVGMRLNMPTR